MQSINRFLFALLFLFLPSLVHASYVQGGTTPGSTGTSIVCSPNDGTGSVVSGHLIVMAIINNGGGSVSITSTRVPTWTNYDPVGGTETWYGIATSSGVETITVTIGPSTQFAAVCGEYSLVNTLDVSNFSGLFTSTVSVTTTRAITTLIVTAGTDPGASFVNFTLRKSATMFTAPNGLLLLGDLDETSVGTYTSTTSANAHQSLFAFYTPTLIGRHRLLQN